MDEDLDLLMFDEWDGSCVESRLSNFGEFSSRNSSNNHSSLFNNTVNNEDCSSSRLDVSALCCDEELFGYDKNAGGTWIYPTNYPVRDYQFNIISNALFKNTLVSLPTGLGKTFIAAVVMYNFYRWYPLGKIVFTAPTRPLVAQQIDACFNIMAIPQQDTVEMTGSMPSSARKIAWKQKRVFFATPQVVNNDLESGICPGQLIRCLVIDEAHRARGKHAYCQLVEGLALKNHTLHRILALSATPGSKVDDVIAVVKNLHISHLELRSEQCIDVAMYSHSKKIDTIVIPLGDELTNIRKQFVEIMDIYTRRLVQYRILNSNIGGLSKGRVIMLFKEYQHKERTQRHPQHQRIMQDFTMVITLCHALELLTKHGARVFLNFFDERTDKQWVGRDDNLTCFLERLRDDLGVNPFTINRNVLPDGTIPEIKVDLKFGHPKFDHLKKVIMEHFDKADKNGQTTKAIIFCEYRESVNLVHCLLLQCRPLIRPHVFIGQGLGSAGSKDPNMKAFSQKQQLKVMKMFRENICNVLVSTCIGEEGLDVGSVDLIICFDISNKSPIRLVQRCGRTGREREGRVVILVTEGREHQTLRECILQRDSLNNRVLKSKELVKNLYSVCPRMLPSNVKPQCQKMFITVPKPKPEEKVMKNGKVQSKLKDLFAKGGTSKSRDSINEGTSKYAPLTNEDLKIIYPNGIPSTSRFQDNIEHWNKSKDFFKVEEREDNEITNKLNLSVWLEWQRTLQFTACVEHSVDSEILSHLLNMADSKRFSRSSTPPINEDFVIVDPDSPLKAKLKTPPKVNKAPTTKGKNKTAPPKSVKNDIRCMFQRMYKPTEEELEKAAVESKTKEIFEACGFSVENTIQRDKILEEDGITSAMIDLMVDINIQLPKWEISKQYQYEQHKVFREQHHKPFSDPECLSEHFELPTISTTNCIKYLQDIDLVKFAEILKLDDSPKKDKTENKINNLSVEIDFCDDSMFRNNSQMYGDEVKIFSRTDNKSIINCNNEIDCDISKIMINDDFDLGDIDDIFDDTVEQVENKSNDKNKSNIITKNICASDKNGIKEFEVSIKDVFDNSASELDSKIVFDNDFEFGDIDDIFDNTDDELSNDIKENVVTNVATDLQNVEKPVENKKNNDNEKKPNTLTYFGLDDLDDLFNDDFDETDVNKQDKEIKDDEDIGFEPPNSPILLSQRPSLTKSKNMFSNNHITSTPIVNNASRKMSDSIPKCQENNMSLLNKDISILSQNFYKNNQFTNLDKPTKSNLNSNNKILNGTSNVSANLTLNKTVDSTANASALTITQIINIVNKDNKTIKKSGIVEKETKKNENDSSDSSESVILCSQAIKPVKQKAEIDPKISLTILETSESSDEDIIVIKNRSENIVKETKMYNKFDNIKAVNETSKRKFISSDEDHESSPFFKDTPIASPLLKRNKMSLREKISLNGLKTPPRTEVLKSSNLPCRSEVFKSPIRSPVNLEQKNNKFKSPVNLLSKLSQFSKSKSLQWNSDASQTQRCVKTTEPANVIISSDEDDFVSKLPRPRTKLQRSQSKRKRCQFIDDEAALSEDSYQDSGDDENSQDGDTSIHKFICDEEHVDDEVDMQAKYLQSVKSPVKSNGQFKIPMMKPKVSDVSVFSQPDPDEHVNYVLDSFCVDDHIVSQRYEMSELELAEAILKKRKRRKKKAKQRSPSPVKENVPCNTNPADDSPIGAKLKKRVPKQIQSESSTDDELFL